MPLLSSLLDVFIFLCNLEQLLDHLGAFLNLPNERDINTNEELHLRLKLFVYAILLQSIDMAYIIIFNV